jgi:hypothetical protein
MVVAYHHIHGLKLGGFGFHNEHANDASDQQYSTYPESDVRECMMRTSDTGHKNPTSRESDDAKSDHCIVNHWILH